MYGIYVHACNGLTGNSFAVVPTATRWGYLSICAIATALLAPVE